MEKDYNVKEKKEYNLKKKNIMGTLANGIKDIFSTSQTTATHLPVCASDGTPQGRISVGDLASVLGGMMFRPQQLESFDIDVAQQLSCGLYQTKEPSTGFPTTSYGTLIVFLGSNGFKMFMWIDQRSGKLYYRSNWSASFKSNWLEISVDIPTFYKNYNDLSSLSTGLGVLAGAPIAIDTPNYDVNDAPHGYICLGHTARVTAVNNPFPGEVVGILTIRKSVVGIGDIRLQIAFRDNSIKIRCFWVNNGWGEWKTVA